MRHHTNWIQVLSFILILAARALTRQSIIHTFLPLSPQWQFWPICSVQWPIYVRVKSAWIMPMSFFYISWVSFHHQSASMADPMWCFKWQPALSAGLWTCMEFVQPAKTSDLPVNIYSQFNSTTARVSDEMWVDIEVGILPAEMTKASLSALQEARLAGEVQIEWKSKHQSKAMQLQDAVNGELSWLFVPPCKRMPLNSQPCSNNRSHCHFSLSKRGNMPPSMEMEVYTVQKWQLTSMRLSMNMAD